MKTIHVKATKEYDVLVGHGLLAQCGQLVASVCVSRTAAIVSDDIVFALYGQTVKTSLEASGFRVLCHVFQHGEKSKNILEYTRIVNFLAEHQVTRSDVIVALGGGVTGDMAGFAAATYQRGIRFVQVPTTLLAAVDSSVGGKTAIDLPVGKNLVGAFYQPELVICDLDTLASLPDEIFSDGCAEVVKYAVLGSPRLFQLLSQAPNPQTLEDIVALCVEQKRNVVAADEFDRGLRQMLNLGHTFGHAVETCSRFTLSHGKAVAIGMMMAARAAQAREICPKGTVEDIQLLLDRCGLPTQCPYSADMLLGAMLADKKRSGGLVNLILPERMGKCRIQPTPVEEMPQWLRLGGAL